MLRIELDHDRIPPTTRAADLGTLVEPQECSPSPHGVHSAFIVDGLPEWVEQRPLPDSDDRAHRLRRLEVLTLLRDLLGAGSAGYDRRAPLDQPLRQHQPWRFSLAAPPAWDIETLLGLVDLRRQHAWQPATDEQIDALRSLGYEPGGRYTRDKCWRDDHATGGHGRGCCVSVFADGSGVYCFGGHTGEDGGPACIATSSLLAQHGLMLDAAGDAGDDALLPALRWAAATPEYRHAVDGLGVVLARRRVSVDPDALRRLVAALRLRRLCSDPVPRPLARQDRGAVLVWDADVQCIAQYLPDSGLIDCSVDKRTRGPDLRAAYPSLWYWGLAKKRRKKRAQEGEAGAQAGEEGGGEAAPAAAEGEAGAGVGGNDRAAGEGRADAEPARGDGAPAGEGRGDDLAAGAAGADAADHPADGGAAPGGTTGTAGRPAVDPPLEAWIESPDDKALLAADKSRVQRHGVVRLRTTVVPRLFGSGTPEWVCEEGAPVRLVLPGGRPCEPATCSVGEAAAELATLIGAAPVPAGMAAADATALRLSYLLPALTESFPGGMPVMFFAGGLGAGKGRSVHTIQACWHHHYKGQLLVTDPKELDNALVAGRRGAIWQVDEFNASIREKTVEHLKAVMTFPEYRVRAYHTQVQPVLRMAHAWFATGRTISGPGGKDLESDWKRRIVAVQFPQTHCGTAFLDACWRYPERFDPLRVTALLARLTAGMDEEYVRHHFAPLWPDAMPGWQACVGIGQMLGLAIDAAEQRAKVQTDQKAFTLLLEWLADDTAHDMARVRQLMLARRQLAFSPIRQWLYKRGERSLADGPRTFANTLLSQSGNEFDLPAVGPLPAGRVRIYENDLRFRWVPAGEPDDETPPTPPAGEPGSNGNGHAPVLPARRLNAPVAGSRVAEARRAVTAPVSDPFAALHAPARRKEPAHVVAPEPAPAPFAVLSGAPRAPVAGRRDGAGQAARAAGQGGGAGSPAGGAGSGAAAAAAAFGALAKAPSAPSAKPARQQAPEESREEKPRPPQAVEAEDRLPAAGVNDDPEPEGGESGGSARPDDPPPGPRDDAGPARPVPYATTFDPDIEPRDVVTIDFESSSNIAISGNARRYWENGTTRANCLVATWWNTVPGPQYGRAMVVIWSRTPLRQEPRVPLLAPHCMRHLQRFSALPPVVQMFSGDECPAPLATAARNMPFVAHNAQFDARAWRALGWPEPAAWYDTLHLARAALGFGKLDIALARLYGTGKVDVPPGFQRWETLSEGRRHELLRYCASDAIPTASLFIDLAARVRPWELRHSRLDFVMNDRGLCCDRELACGIFGAAGAMQVQAGALADEAVRAIGETAAPSLKSNKQMVEWCLAHGLRITNVKGRTIEAVLDDEDQPEWYEWLDVRHADTVRAVLRANYESVGIAGGKAKALLDEVNNDGRLRDQVQHRRARTGRAAGRGLQPQNLLRPLTKPGKRSQHKSIKPALEQARRMLQEWGVELLPYMDA